MFFLHNKKLSLDFMDYSQIPEIQIPSNLAKIPRNFAGHPFSI
jgi:hypothetical protein